MGLTWPRLWDLEIAPHASARLSSGASLSRSLKGLFADKIQYTNNRAPNLFIGLCYICVVAVAGIIRPISTAGRPITQGEESALIEPDTGLIEAIVNLTTTSSVFILNELNLLVVVSRMFSLSISQFSPNFAPFLISLMVCACGPAGQWEARTTRARHKSGQRARASHLIGSEWLGPGRVFVVYRAWSWACARIRPSHQRPKFVRRLILLK